MSLGLQTGLRTLAELRTRSAWEKRLMLRVAPSKVVEDWSFLGEGVYQAFVEAIFDNLLLPVTGMRCSVYPYRLQRVETLADCQATESTFFYDPDITYQGTVRSWDDGLPWWDADGEYWDLVNRMYVHLPAGTVAATTTIVAEYSLWFSNRGHVIEDLGQDKLTNGGFEAATSNVPTGWSIDIAGGPLVSATADDAIATRGSRSVALYSEGGLAWDWDLTVDPVWDESGYSWDVGLNPSAWMYQTVSVHAGARYLLSGTYKHDVDNDAGWGLYLRLGTSTGGYLQTDGYTFEVGGDEWIPIPSSDGEVRRWRMEFVAAADADLTLDVRGWNEDAGGAAPGGTIYVDEVSVRRIWRYVFADPRLDASSLPTTSQGSRDVWFGGIALGAGDTSLLIADGALDKLLSVLDWNGATIEAWDGGAYPDGELIPCEECAPEFSGVIDEIQTDNLRASFSMLDARTRLDVSLPLRRYTAETTPDVPESYLGKARPMLVGTKSNITPVPLESSGDYLTYEVADTDGSPAGLKAISAVYQYADSTAASEKDSTRRTTLSLGTDYSQSLSAGSLTMLRDVQLLEIADDRNYLDVTDDTGTIALELTTGLYMPHELAAHVQTVARAAGSADHSVTYSETTHKLTWSRPVGTLELLLSSGANRDRSAWSLMGYSSGSDLTGATTYTADALWADGDEYTRHIIRVDAQGYADDSSGTWTGTASGLISGCFDQVRMLVGSFLKRPEISDDPSFDLAAELLPAVGGFYLTEVTNFRDLLDMYELSTGARLVLDCDGLLYAVIPGAEGQQPVVDLLEADLLSFSQRFTTRDTCGSVVITYDSDPSTGATRSREVTAAGSLRYGKGAPRTFDLLLTDDNDAVPRCSEMASLASTAPRLTMISVKGLLQSRRIGASVRLTRSRAVSDSGEFDAQEFQIVYLEKAPVTAVANATLVEV